MTKSIRSFSLLLALSGAVACSGVAFAHDGPTHEVAATKTTGQLVPTTDVDAGWLAKAKAEYPSKTCFVSGDDLGGDMGKSVDYIWREEGKPDRLISFCCKDCVRDFKKDPQKYLKELDDAKAAAHAGHSH